MSFDEDVALVRTTDGFDMHIIPGEHIGTQLYLTGEYERSVVSMLLKYAGQDDVLLDIGANVGYVSACFLHNVPRSKVFAVEPQPRIVDLLRANLRSFGPDRHEVFPVGISDADADGWLEMSSWNSGAAKVSAEQGDNSAAIQLWSAKTLFEATKGEKIDLVKIDVEGHEEIVLRGCESEFARLRPKAIVFENQTGTAAPTGSLGRIFNRLVVASSGSGSISRDCPLCRSLGRKIAFTMTMLRSARIANDAGLGEAKYWLLKRWLLVGVSWDRAS